MRNCTRTCAVPPLCSPSLFFATSRGKESIFFFPVVSSSPNALYIQWYYNNIFYNIKPFLSQKNRFWKKVNNFPATGEISRKDCLSRNIARLQQAAPEEFDFVPRGWIIPAELYGMDLIDASAIVFTHHYDSSMPQPFCFLFWFFFSWLGGHW